MLMIFDQECSFANHWKKEENKSELLELGAVVVDENYEIQSNFNSYVKPMSNPELSEECMELLGDIQSKVDSAPEFPVVMERFDKWVQSNNVNKIASWGISDRTFILKQISKYELKNTTFELEYIDLKKAFRKSRPIRIKPVGLKKAAEIVGAEIVEPHHSALNDAFTALNVLRLMPQL
ncbi:3'-5' exonuclease [Kangiella taiwanensis]|uniref:Exonuclease domain-containing protein n=1 Tax=Kangiella taiwanensis TaxID=1079179 RepID=A0ABP8I7Z2_9GAMM|nr:3'-5' exonuclease [Kangiella taiwanensis]RDX37702.1 hypothetical protein DZA50_01625 [Kangiella sp. HD9-110m-PIT-SAG07]